MLGVLPGILGTIQAAEAIKYLLDIEGSLAKHLLLVEAQSMQLQTIALEANPDCPTCNSSLATANHNSLHQSDHVRSTPNNSALLSVSSFLAGDLDPNTVLIDVRSLAEHLSLIHI